MDHDTDALFEKRLRALLAVTDEVTVPALTEARLHALRRLVPHARAEASTARARLVLAWERVADEAGRTLTVITRSGLGAIETMPLLRGEADVTPEPLRPLALDFADGRLVVSVIDAPTLGERVARICLSVTGDCSRRDDLSLELSRDGLLVEARPAENAAEFVLRERGRFAVALLAGSEQLATVEIAIE